MPAGPFRMLMGYACQQVKSPTNCTFAAAGAARVKVCVLPFPPPAFVFFVLFFFAVFVFRLRPAVARKGGAGCSLPLLLRHRSPFLL